MPSHIFLFRKFKLIIIILAFILGIAPLSASKNKVLIFFGGGGKGHTIAAQAVTEHLEVHFECVAKNIFDVFEVKESESYIASIQAENIKPSNDYWESRNEARDLQDMKSMNSSLEKLQRFIAQENPTLIISVASQINYALATAAKNMRIPFILSILDADFSPFLLCLKYVNNSDLIRLTVPYPITSQKICDLTAVPPQFEQKTIELGMPLRKAFTDIFDEKEFRARRNFAPDCKNILLIMGGLGSNALLRYVEKFSKSENKYHVFICIGTYEKLRNDLQPFIENSKNTTFEIVPFTQDIPYFMRTVDLIITKPGGVTCGEVLLTETPTLFDATKGLLAWEKNNMKKVIEYGYGKALSTLSNLDEAIEDCLIHPRFKNTSFRTKQLEFGKGLLECCNELIKEAQ